MYSLTTGDPSLDSFNITMEGPSGRLYAKDAKDTPQ
jgi:hypothetical protein